VLKEIDPLVVAAYLLWYKDEKARALAILDQVLEGQIPSDWNPADPFVMKTPVFINSADYAAAIAAANEAIRLQPRYAPSHIVSGDVLKAQHQNDAALSEYRMALQLDPENSAVQVRIAGILRAQQKTAEATKYIRVLIVKYPRRPGYHVQLGRMLREQLDKVGADAERCVAKLVEIDVAVISGGVTLSRHAARSMH
jgi:tetratricopeptide (TPR) repeat protein